jgi:hypothetical protein
MARGFLLFFSVVIRITHKNIKKIYLSPTFYETKSGSPPRSKTTHLTQLNALSKYPTNYIEQQMYFGVLFFRRT